MSEKFFTILLNMLKEHEMSISSISRELKTKGYDHHRLIITGYLRALYDAGYLDEKEIPPSKVYSYNHKKQEKDVFRLIGERIKQLDPENKFPVAVFILTGMFNRPCFKYELNLMGITPNSSPHVKESRNEHLREFREGITRFEIPAGDKAYEMNGNDAGVITSGLQVIFGLMKDTLDLTGLKSRYQSTQISQFIDSS